MNQHFLEFKNVATSYGAIKALAGVSLYVDEGEIVTLIGSNGAGKSTLLNTIFKQPKLTNGEILFRNTSLEKIAPNNIARQGIALVPEGRRVFSSMSVEENLIMGAISLTAIDYSVLERVYAMFPVLQERKSQRAGTLSGGEQQMLAIGRGLMAKPKLLLLDEPSLGLAPIIIANIFRTIKEIAKQGMTIFFVEQNANHALKTADRAYVLVNGQIKLSGTGQEMLHDPEVKEAYLGAH